MSTIRAMEGRENDSNLPGWRSWNFFRYQVLLAVFIAWAVDSKRSGLSGIHPDMLVPASFFQRTVIELWGHSLSGRGFIV